MSLEILVNATTRETRAAFVENGVLQEIHIERASRRGLVSNLYKGRVSRVLPGMQAAFVDIGLDRTAFLHAADIAYLRPDDTVVALPAIDDIRRLVNPGDEILVQVIKDPIGTKGARLTTFVALPSRYLVYMPRGEGVGISTRIEEEAERVRLKTAVTERLRNGDGGGYIVRTAAAGVSSESLSEDMEYLDKLWTHVKTSAQQARPGEIVHEDLPLTLRLLRDELARGVSRVLVDSPREHARMVEFCTTFIPGCTTEIELYGGPRPIFDLHGIEEEIARALDRKVPLKSGGHLVIDQTEAMTTIDVNTGAYVGTRNLEETIFRTNLEAAVAIARQLRLRNLGGIIIIDFIDMKDESHRRQVLTALERALATDRAPSKVLQFNDFGLVAITRKRVKQSLERTIGTPCPYCDSTGFVKSVTTVCNEIYIEMRKIAKHLERTDVMLRVNPEVAKSLKANNGKLLIEMEELCKRTVIVKSDPSLHQEQFDIN
jgi:ribonuclease G